MSETILAAEPTIRLAAFLGVLVAMALWEVAAPRPGDRIVIDDATYTVQGEPARDRERLVFTFDARPV